jgi:hypothetical protein
MTSSLSPSFFRPTLRARQVLAGLAGLALGAAGWLAATPSAQAADVYWSIGVHQSGVSVGVSNAPPVVLAPPRVVYAQPRVVLAPAPVVLVPHVVYPAHPVHRAQWAPPGHAKHWHQDRRHGHRHGGGERHAHRSERWDDRGHRR